VDAPVDLRINRDIEVRVRARGLAIHLVFLVSGKQSDIGSIELSRAEAIELGREIALNWSSNRIPIAFEPEDALAFGELVGKFLRATFSPCKPKAACTIATSMPQGL